MPPNPTPRAMRILIVKRDKLGDLLLTTPVLEHLAAVAPQAEIHLLANDYNAWVAHGHPALARTWTYPRARAGRRLRLGALAAQIPLLLRLRRQRYDWALVMGGDESHRAIWRALAVGARRVVAYVHDPADYDSRLTDPLAPPLGGHETMRMLRLLAPLGFDVPPVPPVPRFALPAVSAAFAAQWLAAQGIEAGGYVVLGLGARRAKKQPSADQAIRWTQRLHTEFGLPTVLMWTPGAADNPIYPGDDALAQAVLARAGAHVHPFRGPIADALGLIFSARTTVMPDSGLMHFAAASPGGVVGLFADPQDSAPAARWAPLGARARHIEAARAVADLSDDDIFAVLRPLLAPTRASDRARDSAPDRCTS